ncbi:MAG: FAD:protein FMN transferase [Desulfarculaceae bacterium]|nr:FAD:protein FMN transferase [Desulfarculaceae bacterium]
MNAFHSVFSRPAVILVVLLYLILPAKAGAGIWKSYRISGRTMGTSYHITVATRKRIDARLLKEKIDVKLKMINRQMSVFRPKSEISRFNRADENEWVDISEDFSRVVKKAEKIYRLTDGSWDGTVKPLLELWNFGPGEKTGRIPDDKKIERLLKRTGFNNVILSEKGLLKKTAGLELDLGSIAKGFGVDAVSSLLKNSGFDRYLVEIGGEVFVSGRNAKGENWRIGISDPSGKAGDSPPYRIVSLKDQALATSGTYRNFIQINGRTFSHIIDPRTGRPVENRVVSASVAADDCTFADGLATALMVMEIDKGLKLVNRLENTECMILKKDKSGSLSPFYSSGFRSLLHTD